MAHFRRPRALRRGLGDDGGPRRRHPCRPRAASCVWLLEHPPLYTAGTSARAADLLQPMRFPVHAAGRGGQYTYHGPGQRVVYAMLDLRRRRQDVRRFVSDLEEWTIRALARFNVTRRAPARPGRRLGGARRRPRGQDRRHRRAHPPLGVVPRHLDQPRARPVALCRHRALRHRRARRDLAGRPRPAGDHGRSRHGAGETFDEVLAASRTLASPSGAQRSSEVLARSGDPQRRSG